MSSIEAQISFNPQQLLTSLEGDFGSGSGVQGGFSGGFSQQSMMKAFSDIEAALQFKNDPKTELALLKKAEHALKHGSDGGDGGGAPQSTAGAGTPSPLPTNLPSPLPTDPPVDGSDPSSSAGSGSGDLSVNGNSVNTGQYTITGSTSDDGSLTITNNQTGQSTEVWGDPHVKVNGQDTAEFQKGPLNIQLQDGTTVHIDPTALQNGVAHIGQVSITKGNQSVTMGGASSNGFEGSVNTSQVTSGNSGFQSGLYNAPNATDITLGSDGNLYYNNPNGSMGQEITAKQGGGETDLDGAGGGLEGQHRTHGGGGNDATQQQIQQTIQKLMQMLEGDSESFFNMSMMQTLQTMMPKSTASS